MGDVSVTVEKPTFESCYPEISRIVASRKSAWTYVSLLEWNDVASIVTTRIWQKWHLFDPAKGPLENWANTIISRALLNLRRDNALRYARPCVKGCAYNLGADLCGLTKSGTQCTECPLYKEWNRSRRHQFNIKSTVSLEHHTQEVSTMPQDVFDIESVQNALHQQMRANLDPWDWKIYRMLYVHHLKPAAISEELQATVKKWKRAPRETEGTTYQFILIKQRWFKELMFAVLKKEGYDIEALIDYVR